MMYLTSYVPPLARLQTEIGLVRQKLEKIDTSLDRIERECIRIDALVGELLTLSRIDAGVVGNMQEEVHISDVVADIVEDARFEANALGKPVHLHDSCRIAIQGHADLFYRAIENVLRNAVRYTKPDSVVHVYLSCEEKERGVHIAICDEGLGVPDTELHAIFEPFFRSEKTKGIWRGMASV